MQQKYRTTASTVLCGMVMGDLEPTNYSSDLGIAIIGGSFVPG